MNEEEVVEGLIEVEAYLREGGQHALADRVKNAIEFIAPPEDEE